MEQEHYNSVVLAYKTVAAEVRMKVEQVPNKSVQNWNILSCHIQMKMRLELVQSNLLKIHWNCHTTIEWALNIEMEQDWSIQKRMRQQLVQSILLMIHWNFHSPRSSGPSIYHQILTRCWTESPRDQCCWRHLMHCSPGHPRQRCWWV